ncbi:hypothetical protein U1Q18_031604 [Sarracenia purpurea var. burkii]
MRRQRSTTERKWWLRRVALGSRSSCLSRSGKLYSSGCSTKLVNARYLEWCPPHEPFLAPAAKEETAAKKRGAKSAKVTEESETMEQRALAAASPMKALRFLVVTYAVTVYHQQDSEGNLPSVAVGEKVGVMISLNLPGLATNSVMIDKFLYLQRKQVDLELDTEARTKKRKKEVLWRANF